MTTRRQFITLLGGAATAWPLAARGQQYSMSRQTARLAVLIAADGQVRLRAVQEQLAQLGWVVGHNLQLEYRLTEGDQTKINAYATELVRAEPDVILAGSTAAVAALLRETLVIPRSVWDHWRPPGLGPLRVGRDNSRHER